MTDFISFSQPDIGTAEIDAVNEVLQSGWITTGARTARFEEEFKRYVRSPHAIAVNSCTAGLHLALAALGIGNGDEVITTPLTFCATVNVILQTGATPVLADIGTDLNISPDSIERAVTRRTRAVIPVHFAGLPCDMDAIWSIAARHSLRVIEDAAHAVGATFKDTPIGGGKSDAVVFSFYATKNMTTGEGGMVTTRSKELSARLRTLCLHGLSKDAWARYSEKGHWYYEVSDLGFKYNMSDIMAALGVVQLQRLDDMNARRAQIANQYNRAFCEMEEVELPPQHFESQHAWHLYVLRLNGSRLTIDRARFIQEMEERGIGCSVHFIPIPLHPLYRRLLVQSDSCPHALEAYQTLVSLPMYSKMTDGDVKRVIDAVKDVAATFRSRVRVSVDCV